VSDKVWYLEALDAHTNEVIASEITAEMAQHGILCQDGTKRDFWECQYATVAMLLRNEHQLNLHFKVFYRQGRYGPVKLWPFAGKKKMTLVQGFKKGIMKKVTA
jgi:hypothetical protein